MYTMRFLPCAEFGGKTKYLEPARIRTWNLLIRSQTRYPLRHRSNYFDKKLAFAHFLIPVYPMYYKFGQPLHWRKLRHTFHNKCSPKLIIVISHEGHGTWVYTRLQQRSQRNWTIPAKTHHPFQLILSPCPLLTWTLSRPIYPFIHSKPLFLRDLRNTHALFPGAQPSCVSRCSTPGVTVHHLHKRLPFLTYSACPNGYPW